MIHRLIFLLFIPCCCSLHSQSIDAVNFERADSIALSVKGRFEKDPEALARQLTDPLGSNVEKVRAIYRWIAANIDYDLNAYEKEHKRSINPYHVLKKGKAVCAGYSALFQTLCGYAGIECEYITGLSRNRKKQIGKHARKSDHAWNLVNLAGKWYPIDVTWGSGSVDWEKKKFIPGFDDAYFLSNPLPFQLSHFPDDEDWLDPAYPMTKADFFRSPLAGKGALMSSVSAYLPSDGMITQAPNEQIKFWFRFTDELYNRKITFVAEPIKGREKESIISQGFLEAEGDQLTYTYAIPQRGNYYLHVFMGGKPALTAPHFLTYRLIVK